MIFAGSLAAELEVVLDNAPDRGVLVFQVYDAADAFGDLRDPAQEIRLPATGADVYRLADIADGNVAVLVYHDENENGLIDKNFIGIPRERLAFSNGYQPKGPPSFSRASFRLGPEGPLRIDLEMYRVLGERGRLGLGAPSGARPCDRDDSGRGKAETPAGAREGSVDPFRRPGLVVHDEDSTGRRPRIRAAGRRWRRAGGPHQ